jgi:hypothetical protein
MLVGSRSKVYGLGSIGKCLLRFAIHFFASSAPAPILSVGYSLCSLRIFTLCFLRLKVRGTHCHLTHNLNLTN